MLYNVSLESYFCIFRQKLYCIIYYHMLSWQFNRRAHIRHQCRKTIVLSCQKCLIINGRHERDSRQSQSRSGEISKLSRRHFSGFREKVPFSLVKAADKLRLGTTLNGTRAVHFLPLNDLGGERIIPKQCRARNGNVPFKYVHEKNSVPLPFKWNFCVCYSFKIFAGIPSFSVHQPLQDIINRLTIVYGVSHT